MSGELRKGHIRQESSYLPGLVALAASPCAIAVVPVQPQQTVAASAPPAAVDPAPKKSADPITLDRESLPPASERTGASPGPPPAVHDYWGKDGTAAPQSGSAEVNAALDLMRVKVPGFGSEPCDGRLQPERLRLAGRPGTYYLFASSFCPRVVWPALFTGTQSPVGSTIISAA